MSKLTTEKYLVRALLDNGVMSKALFEEELQDQMDEFAPELAFVERLANPPAFADADSERGLKVLVYRAPDI